MAYWGKTLKYTKQIEKAIVLGDGVNTANTPFEIKPSEAVSSLNTCNRQYPAISTRPGSMAMYGTGASPITTPNGAGTRNGADAHWVDGTTWNKWTGSAIAAVATGLTNARAKILEFNTQATKYTILVNGTDKKYYDGSSVADITGGPTTPYYAVDDFRLYALKDRTIHSSAAGSLTDWSTVDDSDENVCVGMIGTETALAAFNDMIIAWSDQTMHILYGNDPTDYQLMDPMSAGCVSDRSVIVVDGVLYFMDYNKFKAFTGGLPVDVSQKVKSYLENINYTYKQLICSGRWGKYIYLSFPYGAAQTTNNLTLEYDTETKTWYPYDVGFVAFYNIGQALYGITAGGIAKKLNTGTADDTTAITWEHTTGVWSGTPVRSRKVVSDLWLVADLPLGSTLTLSYSQTIDGAFTVVKELTADADEQNTRVQIPTNILAGVPWYRLKLSGTGPCTIHYIEPYTRVKER